MSHLKDTDIPKIPRRLLDNPDIVCVGVVLYDQEMGELHEIVYGDTFRGENPLTQADILRDLSEQADSDSVDAYVAWKSELRATRKRR